MFIGSILFHYFVNISINETKSVRSLRPSTSSFQWICITKPRPVIKYDLPDDACMPKWSTLCYRVDLNDISGFRFTNSSFRFNNKMMHKVVWSFGMQKQQKRLVD